MTTVTSLPTHRRTSYVAAVAVMLLVLALLATARTAQAEKWSGHMPAKTWGTNGAYTSLSWVSGYDSAGLSICVTPAEYSGGWSFPYGWTCHAESAVWVNGTVNGYPAIDNPTSREYAYSVEYW